MQIEYNFWGDEGWKFPTETLCLQENNIFQAGTLESARRSVQDNSITSLLT